LHRASPTLATVASSPEGYDVKASKLQAASAVVAAAVIGAGLIAYDAHFKHPRDEKSFLYWSVETGSLYPSQLAARQPWVQAHRTELLVEGDIACRWLVSQPFAPEVDPSGRFDIGALVARYLKQDSRPPVAPDTHDNEWIAVEAWGNLCQDLRDEHFAPTALGDD
jgi:hypothetical protein